MKKIIGGMFVLMFGMCFVSAQEPMSCSCANWEAVGCTSPFVAANNCQCKAWSDYVTCISTDGSCKIEANCTDGKTCIEGQCRAAPSTEDIWIQNSMNNCVKQGWKAEYDAIKKQCSCEIWWETSPCCIWTLYNNNKKCCIWTPYDNEKKCCEKWEWLFTEVDWKEQCISCSASWVDQIYWYKEACSDNTAACPWKAYTGAWWASKCCDGTVLNGNCIQNTYGKMWIEIDQDCLINGQCKFNIYKVLNIRKSDQDTISVKTFVQDVLLALTTFFGVLLTAIVVISWLFYVLTPLSEPLKARAKKWLLAWLSWLFLVIWSYAIVRFVQFLATGGGW